MDISPLPFTARTADRRDGATLGLRADTRDPVIHAMRRVAIRQAQLRKATAMLADEIRQAREKAARNG